MTLQGFGQLLGALIRERREAAGMTQRELAEESFPDLKDSDGKERRIRELEAGDVTRPQAQNYTPICETLNIDRATIRQLRARAADAKAQTEAEFAEVVAETGGLEQALDQTSGLSRDQLEAVAVRFGIEGVYDLSDPALRSELEKKAADYRALKAQVEAIDDSMKRLSNLKAGAQSAIARGDLDEVETLLARVQEVELEEAARTAELRADNALLRGRVEQAFKLLSAAADSFAGIDALEPARRRLNYASRLYEHGLRYGGPGLALAAQMMTDALSRIDRAAQPALWARAQNNLAIALQNQGIRAAGSEGAALLAQAVAAYRAAQEVYTRADHPLHWATTQNNLAVALQHQGIRTAGPEGADLLAQAVAAYRAALDVRTRADHPVQWAETQENLAIAELSRSEHDTCTDPIPPLRAALAHVDAALTVYDPGHMPYDHGRATTLREEILAALHDLGDSP